MPAPPPNAYLPGTKLSVGSHKISIIKYLSQGGFAYVYTCNIDPPFQGSSVACLKRVEVPNKWELTLLRQEVDAMRRLRGNKHIVSYIDSHASRMDTASKNSASSGTTPSSQSYEVFLLMEYCENNGLIDMMNSRLMNKLTEPEILTIMYEITAATAMCHHLQPPLIHRDIKIENVLIDRHGVFKLCDFGSSVGYIPPPTTPQEFAAVREDIMQHTTPQYKSPEMIDLTRGFPIDDKSDIWALGVFMYKLLYYTTPFESASQKTMQDMESDILNCATTLKFKDQPGSMFSPRLKNIVKCCLREDPRRRPNAVQLLGEIAAMKGVPMPEVIPYSVRHMRHSQTGKVQPAVQKVVAPAPQPSVPSLPPRKDPFSSIDKSSLLRRPNSTYDRPKSFIEGSYSQHNKSSNSIQDYIQSQIEITKSNEQIAPDQNEATNTLDFLRGKEEENQRQDTGGSFKASLKILRKISTGGSISSLTANHTNEKKKWGREREARERDITPTARDRERDVTPRSMAREREVEKEREKEREKAKESAQVKSSKMGSSLKPTVSHKSTGKSSKTTPSTSVVKSTSKPAVKPAAKPTAKSATSHIAKSAAASSSVKPTTSPDTGLKKLSIQKRMQILFTNQESEIIAPISTGLKKTAKGYGRYTVVAPDEEIDAINKSSSPSPPLESKRKSGLVPPKIPLALSAKKPQARSSTAQVLASYKAITPPVRSATVSAKKTPPKPTKPSHLKASAASDRRLSDASEISLPDLDDLEKQFARRFPSYV